MPQTLLQVFLYLAARAHHLNQLFIVEEVQTGVLPPAAQHELCASFPQLLNFTLDLLVIDRQERVLSNEPDRVVQVKALDQLQMGVPQLIENGKARNCNVLLVRDEEVSHSYVCLFNILPVK